jgi:hypothetical protein
MAYGRVRNEDNDSELWLRISTHFHNETSMNSPPQLLRSKTFLGQPHLTKNILSLKHPSPCVSRQSTTSTASTLCSTTPPSLPWPKSKNVPPRTAKPALTSTNMGCGDLQTLLFACGQGLANTAFSHGGDLPRIYLCNMMWQWAPAPFSAGGVGNF